jgi:SAM-dependent methyltransferase
MKSVLAVDWNLSSVADLDARIRELAAKLPEDGAARIGYDAYPGFHFQEILRDLAGYHCRDIQDVKERREQTMAILGFVAGAGQSLWIQKFLQAEIERLKSLSMNEFDFEFAVDRRAFRRSEIRERFAPYGLSCAFGPVTLDAASEAIVRRAPAEKAPEKREANVLYHDIAYPEYLHAGLHPERLHTMARIFGLNPPPVEHCRVLELGCGRGVTLLNTALDLGSSQFVGVDFSKLQIAEAKASAARLQLSNIEFFAMDIADFDASLGQFDYIVAHGMYSWLPAPIRERMLAVCRDHLSPQGLVYISFNAKPGYRLPGMIRDYGLDTAPHQIRNVDDSAAAVERVRAMPMEGLTEVRKAALTMCREHFLRTNPAQMMYDEFGDVNNPFLFDEFASDAARHGLRYVAESEIPNWSGKTLQPSAQQLLDGLIEDPVRRMQYRDFLHLTRFHASVLCRQERQPSYAPLPAVLETMLIGTRAQPLSPNPDVRGATPEKFESPGGVEVSIADPLIKAVLVTLYLARPLRYPFARLLREASELAAAPPDDAKLRQWLQPFWETGLLDLHSRMPPIALEAGNRPLASAFARICAAETLRVPSLLGSGAELGDETDRQLLQLLDGSRDLARLAMETGLEADDLRQRLRVMARQGLLLA